MSETTCKRIIKEYCSKCTFAGIRFIADDTKHYSERLLWLGLVILSWFGSALLIIAAWEDFVQSPISFGLETTYTEWDTKLPSVSICETANNDMIYNVSDTIWPLDHLLDLEDVLRDIAYYRGISYSLVEVCHLTKNPDPLCPMSNYSYYANIIRSDCKFIIRNCSYNDKVFECCEYFQPIDTDMGKCFIINSVQVNSTKSYPMISNMKQKRGILKFDIYLTSTVYTLGEEEIPSITTLQSSTLKIQLGNNYRRQLTVRNIENDALIVETTPEQRACRFHHENENGLYPHYSYSACTVLCRKRGQINTCQCNDHFMLRCKDAERCNISGMACLHTHSSLLTTLKPRWASRPGLTCDCLPSCNETEITVIKDATTSHKTRTEKKKSQVAIVLAYLPTERFKRNVVRSRLDLVVSLGGTTSLFVGASLLSFVEFIFYFTVRFITNFCTESKHNVFRNTERTNNTHKHTKRVLKSHKTDVSIKFYNDENYLRW